MSYNQELYQQVILDHNRKPRNFHEMADATHFCHGYNPLCGDDYTVYLKVDDAGVIQEVSFMGQGCAISKASSSLMTTFLKGKSVEDSKMIFDEFHRMVLGEMDPEKEDHHLGKLTLFVGIREFPSRIKCASLSWHSLMGALDKSVDVTTE